MHLREIEILAATGACLVEGEFRLESDEPELRNLIRPADARVAFRQGRYQHIQLVGGARRDSDGFFSAERPSLELTFDDIGMPSLDALFAHGLGGPSRFECRRENGRLGGVRARHPASGDGPSATIGGALTAVSIEATPEESGLRLRIDGELGPLFAQGLEAPILSQARVVADILVPWIYFKVQSSWLAWRQPGPKSNGRWTGGFEFGDTLVGVAMDEYGGVPIFQGGFTVENSGNPWPRPWGYVHASVREESLVLWPSEAPRLAENGLAVTSGGRNPQLTLPGLGYAAWADILGQHRTETVQNVGLLERRGSGIGFLDQLTGYAAQDVGPQTQPIVACRVDISRRPEVLLIEIEGDLGDVFQAAKPHTQMRAIGPRFRAQLQIPKAYILARNLPIWSYRTERQAALVADAATPS